MEISINVTQREYYLQPSLRTFINYASHFMIYLQQKKKKISAKVYFRSLLLLQHTEIEGLANNYVGHKKFIRNNLMPWDETKQQY